MNAKLFIILLTDIDSKRRSVIVKTLNDKFSHFISNFSISESYAKVVSAKPYKALSGFVYDWTFAPLRRGAMDIPISPKPSQGRKRSSTSPSAPVGTKKIASSRPSTSPNPSTSRGPDDLAEFSHPAHR